MTLSRVDLKLDPNTAHRADDADLQVRVYGADANRVAYVVRAVNAHEALIEALRTALDATDDDRTPQAADDLQAARKLLASLD